MAAGGVTGVAAEASASAETELREIRAILEGDDDEEGSTEEES